jgi:hypothetical protein
MIRLLFSLTEEVANYKAKSSSDTPPALPQPSSSTPGETVVELDRHLKERLAAALPEQQLENVLRFTHAWGLMMSVSAVETVAHPVLGAVAFAQPLLSSCILFRALRAPQEGSLEICESFLEDASKASHFRSSTCVISHSNTMVTQWSHLRQAGRLYQ